MNDIYTKKPEECAYSFTQHTACEFFPCHKTGHPEDFNCLFCYCPLYTLGSKCGGNFRYLETASRTAPTACCPTAAAATATSSPSTRNSWSWPRKTDKKRDGSRRLFIHHYSSSSSSWSPLLHS